MSTMKIPSPFKAAVVGVDGYEAGISTPAKDQMVKKIEFMLKDVAKAHAEWKMSTCTNLEMHTVRQYRACTRCAEGVVQTS